jgi:ParB-like chromosome segregation protein Spo0J
MIEVTLVGIETLKPNDRNARTHARKQVQQIADSITAFGFVNPILVDEEGGIIAGHGRHAALLQLGRKEVPVIVLRGLSKAKRRALAIADNKIAANAGWNRELLALELPGAAGAR